jgi:uncharacterized membrane protein YozB (DUF420 family)
MILCSQPGGFFLVCYIWNHAHHGSPRTRPVADLYLDLRGSHTILAVVIMPLRLTNAITNPARMIRASQENRLLDTPNIPLWFYVSVTGVVAYWMLYHLHAQVAAR